MVARDAEAAGLAQAETLRLRSSEPFLARLQERARAAAERRRPGEPIAVEDRSAPAPPVEEYEPVGPIRYGPPGRILSVR
jgi:hypothetical protein